MLFGVIALGTTDLTINGNNFPTDGSVEVYVGGVMASEISSSTASEIVVRAPANVQGTADVFVKIGDIGYANG